MWAKGKSGNPSGRPKAANEFRERCRLFVDKHVIEKWELEVKSEGKDWMEAAKLLAAYGYGKPSQTLVHEGADGEALQVNISINKPDGRSVAIDPGVLATSDESGT